MRIELSCGVPAMECASDRVDDSSAPSSPSPLAGGCAGHRPVLLQEAVQLLALGPGKTMLDCTVGMGGHSLALLPHLMPMGQLIAMDCDAEAIEQARRRLTEFTPHVQFVHENFRNVRDVLIRLGLPGVHGVIADLGISSLHVDTPERGFSFMREGPLDMRMDQRQPLTAASLIHRVPERELVELLQRYGEERFARRIARRVVEARKKRPIRTTAQLAAIVLEAVPRKATGRIHPATRTFQALRIAVNEELGALQALLESLPDVLLLGGRAAIITFHSLEDRMVKQAFVQGARDGRFLRLTKKPVTPADEELAQNPRARSGKLRAIERVA